MGWTEEAREKNKKQRRFAASHLGSSTRSRKPVRRFESYSFSSLLNWGEFRANVRDAYVNGLNVVNMFDGLSIMLFVLLILLRIPVKKYIAVECDKQAISWAAANLLRAIEGSGVEIIRIDDASYGTCRQRVLDALGGAPCHIFGDGSPCNDCAGYRRQRVNFETLLKQPNGKLFFDSSWLLNALQDNQTVKIIFIKEYCYSAPPETRADMTNTLGISPILIDSVLFHPVRRPRYIWTNLPRIPLPPGAEDDPDAAELFVCEPSLDGFLLGSASLADQDRTVNTLTKSIKEEAGHTVLLMPGSAERRPLGLREVLRAHGLPAWWAENSSFSTSTQARARLGEIWSPGPFEFLLLDFRREWEEELRKDASPGPWQRLHSESAAASWSADPAV